MNLEELQKHNQAAVETIFALSGRDEYIDVGKLDDDHSLWNGKMDVLSQLQHIADDFTFLGVKFSDVLFESVNMYGERVINEKPDNIPDLATPVFSAINSYQYFMEDMFVEFFDKNAKIVDDLKEEDIERFKDRFGLASQTHDSYWGIGIGEKNRMTTFPKMEEIGSRMNELFDWEDFAVPVRQSEKHEGEFINDFFGIEVEYADLDHKDKGEMLFNKFVDFARERKSNTPSIQSSLNESPDTESEITLPVKV